MHALMLGYLMGFEAVRRLALQAYDNVSQGKSLGYGLYESTPDHTTLSKAHQRNSLESYAEAFAWLLKGLRSKETGASYREFVRGLAEAAR